MSPLRYRIDKWRLHRDRHLAEGKWYQVLTIFGICLLATIVIGLLLIAVYGQICLQSLSNIEFDSPYHPSNVFDAAYYLLFNNGGQNLYGGWHIGGLAITTVGIILIALLTSAFTSWFERRAQRFIDGESRYRLKDHIVVFGASDFLYSIISEKTRKDRKDNNPSQVFLIVTTQNVAAVRREVLSFLDKGLDRNNFVFYFGDRTSSEDISTLSLENAREVFVIGDRKESDDIESYRDSNNMDCVEIIGQFLKKHDSVPQTKKCRPLPCHVMFEYQTTFSAFQFCEIPSDIKDHLVFLPFNYYDLWARKVLVTGSFGESQCDFLDTIVDNSGKKSYISAQSEETVHFIILGMTKMGVAMALQAAHICHFPNFISDGSVATDKRKRTRITLIDSDADIESNYFKGRFPCLMDSTRTRFLDFSQQVDYNAWTRNKDIRWTGDEQGWYDVEWEFIKGRIESDPVQNYLKTAAAEKNHIVTIAVCLPKSHQSIASAMYLPSSVYTDCLQILAFQRMSGTIINRLAKTEVKPGESARYKNIIPFGMVSDGYDSSLDNDMRAMLVSYIYDSYSELRPVIKKIADSESLDAPSKNQMLAEQLYRAFPYYRDKWAKKFVTDKLSSTFNANSIGTKLRGIGYTEHNCPKTFTPEQLEELIRVEHNRWNIEKMLTGYRSLSDSEMADMEHLRQSDPKHWKAARDKLKSWPGRAHIDICSIEELKRRENQDVIDFDKHLSEAIPFILAKETEEKERITNGQL